MKLIQAFKNWPANTLATSSWLTATQGISRQSIQKYHRAGQIEKVGGACYKRPGESADWSGAVYAMQTQLGIKVHPAGYCALELKGYQHHMLLGSKKEILLWGVPKTVLPRWALNADLGVTFRLKNSSIIKGGGGLIKHNFRGNYDVNISTPERAILEILTEVKDQSTFENAAHITSSLIGLKITLMHKLLKSCHSYKARRLFLFLAYHENLPIAKLLKRRKYDLGTGVIQVVPNGKFIKEFNMLVPKEFASSEENLF